MLHLSDVRPFYSKSQSDRELHRKIPPVEWKIVALRSQNRGFFKSGFIILQFFSAKSKHAQMMDKSGLAKTKCVPIRATISSVRVASSEWRAWTTRSRTTAPRGFHPSAIRSTLLIPSVAAVAMTETAATRRTSSALKLQNVQSWRKGGIWKWNVQKWGK